MTVGDFRRLALQDPLPPGYRLGTARAVSPQTTLRKLMPLLRPAGITRLADLTRLDWIGLPVFQAIRPNSLNISVSMGKGITPVQARVSALMESLESFHAEAVSQPTVQATIGEMRGQLGYDPYALPTVVATAGKLIRDPDHDPFAPSIGVPPAAHDRAVVEWVAAVELPSGAPTWVPLELCHLDFRLKERLCVPLYRATSNGLAGGNTVAEALLHGLCEVIERDAMWRAAQAGPGARREVAPDSISPGAAHSLLARLHNLGFTTRVYDITGPIGLSCFEVFLEHPESPTRYHGAGCHLSRATSCVRALTEAVQSRLGHIAGSREDLYRPSYTPRSRPPASPDLQPAPATDFTKVPDLRWTSFSAAVREVARRVRAVTGMPVVAVDLRRADLALPVVFVFAPGLKLIPPRRR